MFTAHVPQLDLNRPLTLHDSLPELSVSDAVQDLEKPLTLFFFFDLLVHFSPQG